MLSRAGRGRESCPSVLLLAGIPTPSRVSSRSGAPPPPLSPLPPQSSELVSCGAERSCWDRAVFQPQLPVPAGLGAGSCPSVWPVSLFLCPHVQQSSRIKASGMMDRPAKVQRWAGSSQDSGLPLQREAGLAGHPLPWVKAPVGLSPREQGPSRGSGLERAVVLSRSSEGWLGLP